MAHTLIQHPVATRKPEKTEKDCSDQIGQSQSIVVDLDVAILNTMKTWEMLALHTIKQKQTILEIRACSY